MTNLITERIQTTAQLSTVKNTVARPEQKTSTKEKKTSLDKKLLPMGLLSAGAILLYLGVRTPSNVKFFNKEVQNHFPKMKEVQDNFFKSLNNILESAFPKSKEHIETFSTSNRTDLATYVSRISHGASAQEVLNSLNSIFEDLTKRGKYKGGANDFDSFSVKLSKEKRELSENIDLKRHKAKQVLNDFVHVPEFRDGKHKDKIEQARNSLEAYSSKLSNEIDSECDLKLNEITKQLYCNMKEAIIRKRQSLIGAKEVSIETAFKKFREILGLPESFIPQNKAIPTLTNFSKLSPQELKPKALNFETLPNRYLHIVERTDFSKITEKGLENIFAQTSPENNLRDLAFLIDRINLEKALAIAENRPNIKDFDICISKLEFLLNKLHSVGEKELLNRSSINFDNLPAERIRPKLCLIAQTYKKMGITTLENMDEHLVQSNPNYQAFNIRKHIKEFTDNPEEFFS
jgi:hypothetical protein